MDRMKKHFLSCPSYYPVIFFCPVQRGTIRSENVVTYHVLRTENVVGHHVFRTKNVFDFLVNLLNMFTVSNICIF